MTKLVCAYVLLLVGFVILQGIAVRAESVVLFGASGAVGGQVLRSLVENEALGSIYLVGRRVLGTDNLPKKDARIKQIVFPDMMSLEKDGKLEQVTSNGDSLACIVALGAGNALDLSLSAWHKVDVDMAGVISRTCKNIGARYLSLLSSVGVDESAPVEPFARAELEAAGSSRLGLFGVSWWMARIKALAESTVQKSGVPVVHIFRPANIITDESRYGWLDKFVFFVSPWLDPIVPWEWHSVHVRDLGHAIAAAAMSHPSTGDSQVVEYLSYQHFQRFFSKQNLEKDEL